MGWSGSKLLEHKGFRYTLEAARLLKDKLPELHFVLLGDGPLKEELTQLSDDLDNVTMLGHKDDIGNYFIHT